MSVLAQFLGPPFPGGRWPQLSFLAVALLMAGCVSTPSPSPAPPSVAATGGEDAEPAGVDGIILGTNEHHHLRQALHALNMTTTDLGFSKDFVESRFILGRTRTILRQPLALPTLGDEVLRAVSNCAPDTLWLLAGNLLELSATNAATTAAKTPQAADSDFGGLDADLRTALTAFVADTTRVRAKIDATFAALSDDDRQFAAADILSGAFDAEDEPESMSAIIAAGVSSQAVTQAIQDALELDPKPSATRMLDILESVDLDALVTAGAEWSAALDRLATAATNATAWPEEAVTISLPGGDIVVGTSGDDVHTNEALLILDPGGRDIYRGGAGAANGLARRPLAAIVDLAGDDNYESARLLGAGAALFGLAALVDLAGDDRYRADYTGQGAGILGAAILADREGRDVYEARALSQGAGAAGIGLLVDNRGNDHFQVGLCGQAYAGVRSIGLLLDREGEDVYMAGGREPHYGEHMDRFLSFAQGFAIGVRPFSGGGVAALIDLDGNDHYHADVYGQGVSYWYSIGMLLDRAGNDTYSMYHYGQGSGIHLSVGLLFDGSGNDFYTGHALAQGNAHDYSVGMLVDRGGRDKYTADHFSQGYALYNSFGMLVDSWGDDGYYGRQAHRCQGVGQDGYVREYGSLAVLLDLAGRDQYTSGAKDEERLRRPHYGIVYDLGKP